MARNGKVLMEDWDNGFVLGAEDMGVIEEIGGKGEGRESGREGHKGMRLAMTIRGGNLGGGDVVARVRESEGEDKNEESS